MEGYIIVLPTTSKGLTKGQKKKLEKAYAVCTASQEKYGFSEKKKEKCVLAVARRMGVYKRKNKK